MRRSIKAITIFIIILVGCKNEPVNLFTLDERSYEIVKRNKECIKKLNDHYGVNPLHIENEPYVKSLLEDFINFNKDKKYEDVTFISLTIQAEVNDRINLSIGKLANGNGTVTNLLDKSYPSKTIEKYSVEVLKSNFLEIQEKKKGTKINAFMINFYNNNSCDCKYYNNLQGIKVEKIEDLSFFK